MKKLYCWTVVLKDNGKADTGPQERKVFPFMDMKSNMFFLDNNVIFFQFVILKVDILCIDLFLGLSCYFVI